MLYNDNIKAAASLEAGLNGGFLDDTYNGGNT